MNCRLCDSSDTFFRLSDRFHSYCECRSCRVIFADPAGFLSPEAEKNIYDLHQNSIDDPEYLKFLNLMALPVQNHLKPGDFGLDFGSGPVAAMQHLFEKEGWTMDSYDPFYFQKRELLSRKYHFITCSEVVEHFCNPLTEFQRLWSMLIPGGVLGIMTLLYDDDVEFRTWHYRRDETHVLFYRRETFEWLATTLGGSCEFHSNRVIIITKKES